MADQKPWDQSTINGWYNQYLGHDAGGGWQSWSDHPDAESAIKNSTEGQAFSAQARYNKAPSGAAPGSTGAQTNTAVDPTQVPVNKAPYAGMAPGSTGAYTNTAYNRDALSAPGSTGAQTNTAVDPQGQAPSTSGYNREALSQGIQQMQFAPGAQGGGTGDIQAFLTAHPEWSQGVTLQGDKLHLPGGEVVDVYQNYSGSGPGKAWWGSESDWDNSHPGQRGAQTNVGAPGASPGLSSGSSGSQYQSLMDILMRRANQSLSIDPSTDSVIAPQVNAANAQQQQAARNYMSQAAEKGGPNANLGAETRSVNEKIGQQSSALQSQLVQNELTSRRTEIQNALTQQGALLTSEQQMNLQRELAQLDASLRQQQINSGNDQFMANLGLQADNQRNFWDPNNPLNSGRLG